MLAQQDHTPDSKAHPNSPSAPSVDEDESKMEQRRNRLSAPPTAKPKQ